MIPRTSSLSFYVHHQSCTSLPSLHPAYAVARAQGSITLGCKSEGKSAPNSHHAHPKDAAFNHSISRSRERSPSTHPPTHPLATVRFRLWDRVLTQNQDLKMAARVTTSIPMSSFPLLSSVQKRP